MWLSITDTNHYQLYVHMPVAHIQHQHGNSGPLFFHSAPQFLFHSLIPEGKGPIHYTLR